MTALAYILSPKSLVLLIGMCCLVTCTRLSAQLGDTTYVCNGQAVTLEAPSGYGRYAWGPPSTVGYPSDSVLTFTPEQDGPVYLTGVLPLGENRVANFDFNDGFVDWTSEYAFEASSLVPGTMGTVDVSSNFNPTFSECVDIDQSLDANLMLAVNGAGDPQKILYETSVTVEQNTDYVVSYWASQFTDRPATLLTSINGQLAGRALELDLAPCSWQQYYFIWNSGTNTQATLRVSDTPESRGVGFGIDGFVFAEQFPPYLDTTYIKVLGVDTIFRDTTLCPGARYTGFDLDLGVGQTGTYFVPATTGECGEYVTLSVLTGGQPTLRDTVLLCNGDSYRTTSGVEIVVDTTLYDVDQNTSGCYDTTFTTVNFFNENDIAFDFSSTSCDQDFVRVSTNVHPFELGTIEWRRDGTDNVDPMALAVGGTYTYEVSTTQSCTWSGTQTVVRVTTPLEAFSFALDDCTDVSSGRLMWDRGFDESQVEVALSQNGTLLTFDQLAEGVVDLRLTDGNNCIYDTSFFLLSEVSTATQLIELPAQNGERVFAHQAFNRNMVSTWTLDGQPQTRILDNQLRVDEAQSGWLVAEYHSLGGCKHQDSLFLQPKERETFYFPNAFSPNGDGANDVFTLGHVSDVTEVQELVIYDRWGNQVFYTVACPAGGFNQDCGWDGRIYGQAASTGVYMYAATLRLTNGEVTTVFGTVALLL